MASTEGIQQWQVSEPWLNIRCGLGEGPYYESASNTLRFVDIKKKQLHTVSLTEGPASHKVVEFDERITVTADIEGRDPRDAIVVGAKQGLAVLDRKTNKYEYVIKFPEVAEGRIRSNDGGVDPHGRFWMGTMTDFGCNLGPEGSLYCFDGNNTPAPTKVKGDLTIPNTIGWSPDGRTMYFTHSSARTIFAWDYDVATGELSNERVFYTHDGPGEPDGFRIDTEGNLWHAVYGESRVLKISPEGKIVGEVKIPARNATCAELVDGVLYVTTAGDDEGSEEERRYAGAVFRVEVGAQPTPRHLFKL